MRRYRLVVALWKSQNNNPKGQTVMTLAAQVAKYLGKGREIESGSGWSTLCPCHDDHTPSLSVTDRITNGEPDVIVNCHANCDYRDVKKYLVDHNVIPAWKGGKGTHQKQASPEQIIPEQPETKKKSDVESWIWKQAASGNEAKQKIKKYFSGRNIHFTKDFPLPAAIRWNQYKVQKTKKTSISIVASLTTLDDKFTAAVQRIFVEAVDDDINGNAVYKKTGCRMFGNCKGRGVWFNRDQGMRELIIGEGIETTLSVMQATGKNGVAALTTSGMKGIELPEGVEVLYVLVDSDVKKLGINASFAGQRAAIKLAERFTKGGGQAFLVPPCDDFFTDDAKKLDFNDLSNDEIVDRFENHAVTLQNLEWRPPVKEKPGSDDGVDNEGNDNDSGFYTAETLDELHKMNEKYAAVLLGGKFRIIKEFYDHAEKKHMIDFLERSSFGNYFANKKMIVNMNEGKKAVQAGKLWIEWEGRKTYENVIFSPGNNVDKSSYNLFKGFPLKPKKGEWGLMREHIEKIICCGDQELIEYVLAWLARIVQNPGGERPGVALVLTGDKGTGKGIFVNNFGKLFGEAFMPISSQKGFTGQFCIHLSKCLLVFLDEAVWGGNKQSEGVLKALITEPTILFEPKGIDSIALRNYLNCVLASNEEWVVPATCGERRFCVLNLDESKKDDFKYFETIDRQMKNGGYEAMYFDLLRYDYSGVQLRQAPQTEGLRQQIEQTMDNIQSFWYDVLSRGYLLTDHNGRESFTAFRGENELPSDEPSYWPGQVWKSEIYNEFLKFVQRNPKGYSKTNEVHFWRRTYKIVLGRDGWTFYKKQEKRFAVIPVMDEMRTSFSKMNGGVSFDDSQDMKEFDGQF